MKVTIEIELDVKKSGISELYFHENKQEIIENLLLNGSEEEGLSLDLLSYEYDKKGFDEWT